LGLVLDGRARQISPDVFDRFNLILAMDHHNHRPLLNMTPPPTAGKLRMFRGYDPEAVELDVPDPYYGGEEGLVEVVEMARAAARGLAAIPGEDGS
jgi:protein-tyrosine phosphatase